MSENVIALYSIGQSQQSQSSFHGRGIRSPSLNGEAAHAHSEGKESIAFITGDLRRVYSLCQILQMIKNTGERRDM